MAEQESKTVTEAKKKVTAKAAPAKKAAAKKTTAKAAPAKKTAAKAAKKTSTTKKVVAKKTASKKAAREQHYGTGRRKSSVARVFLMEGQGDVTVNGRPLSEYFPKNSHWVQRVMSPFVFLDIIGRFDAMITVKGGGQTGQADAIKLGIARALVAFEEKTAVASENSDEVATPWRVRLRKNGFLTRDSRRVLRKLVGLVKSRKAKQFSKR